MPQQSIGLPLHVWFMSAYRRISLSRWYNAGLQQTITRGTHGYSTPTALFVQETAETFGATSSARWDQDMEAWRGRNKTEWNQPPTVAIAKPCLNAHGRRYACLRLVMPFLLLAEGLSCALSLGVRLALNPSPEGGEGEHSGHLDSLSRRERGLVGHGHTGGLA